MVLRALHAMSLDVALGAMGTSILFSSCCAVPTDPYTTLTMGLSVWIIYTIDHLLDARAIGARAVSFRHQFHVTHFKALATAVVLACVVLLWLLLQLPVEVWKAGCLLAGVVAVYLLVQQWLNGWKELFGAVLYTGGISLPVWASAFHFDGAQLQVLMLILLTAMFNLTLFSWFDWRTDQAQGQSSLALKLGPTRTEWLLKILFWVIIILLIINALTGRQPVSTALIAVMQGWQCLVFFRAGWFGMYGRYRWAGEMVFLFPWLVLLAG